MSRIRILPAASRPDSPWRNGGGSTAEVARHPAGTGSGWSWRVSIATIARDGPFSPFPGCDRILVPIDGAVQLVVGGVRRHVPMLAAIDFRGEDVVHAVDVIESTTDLNVMVARDRVAARVSIASAGSRVAASSGEDIVVVALSDDVVTDAGPLRLLDAAVIGAGSQMVVHEGAVAIATMTSW